ncbi:MAG: hypothetical protein GY720_02095, partial [bacterium]|nr:hypothetical protein [bacterium]
MKRFSPVLLPVAFQAFVPIGVALFFCVTNASAQTDNETLGTDAGASITSGDHNVLLGDYAGTNLTNSKESIMIGNYTGFLVNRGGAAQAADRNIFLGYRAAGGYTRSELESFLADPLNNPLPDIGGTVLDGDDNIFVGRYAGLRHLSGSDNIYIGGRAGQFSSTGSDNTVVGDHAGENNASGDDNTFLGASAGAQNDSGNRNTFVGADAGGWNTSGSWNTAVGFEALLRNETSWGNTAFGHQAAAYIDTGIKNTSLGEESGASLTAGHFNTMVGSAAGNNTVTGNYNTFAGMAAGNHNNLGGVEGTGERNTYLGAAAGLNNQTGSDNVMLGSRADSGNVATIHLDGHLSINPLGAPVYQGTYDRDVSRSVGIGYGVVVTGDDAVSLGSSGVAKGQGAVGIGYQNEANHTNSIAIGIYAWSHADNTAVIGGRPTADQMTLHPAADGVTELGSADYRFTTLHTTECVALAPAATPAEFDLWADDGADDIDKWRISAADSGDFSISTFASGSPAAVLTIANTGLATVAGDL